MKNLLLGLVSILILNFVYAQNGDCTTPSTVVQNDANSLPPGSNFTHCISNPDEVAGQIIIYSTVTSSSDGTLGLVQSLKANLSCSGIDEANLFSTRLAELFPANNCSGVPITPSATIANTSYSSTFNPEWTGLTPNTSYTVRITITVPGPCTGMVDEVCLNQYYPSVVSTPGVYTCGTVDFNFSSAGPFVCTDPVVNLLAINPPSTTVASQWIYPGFIIKVWALPTYSFSNQRVQFLDNGVVGLTEPYSGGDTLVLGVDHVQPGNYSFKLTNIGGSQFGYKIINAADGSIAESGTFQTGNNTSNVYSPIGTWSYTITRVGLGAVASGVSNNPNSGGDGFFDPSIAGAGTFDITYSWNNGASCSGTATKQVTVTCPTPPACSASVGTNTVSGGTLNGSGYDIVDGATLNITNSGSVMSTSGHQLSYAFFSCAPTLPLSPSQLLDLRTVPCYLGSDNGTSTTDNNNSGFSSTFTTLNQVFVLPYTRFNSVNPSAAIVNDGTGCYAVGTLIELNYLPPTPPVCTASVGINTVSGGTLNGSGYDIVDGATLNITNSGSVMPTSGHQLSYAFFSCAPTLPLTPSQLSDLKTVPCYLGSDNGTSTTDNNNSGFSSTFTTLNQVFVLPYTRFNSVNPSAALVNDGTGCYAVGTLIELNYLPPVPVCPSDFTFTKLDWTQNNPFPTFAPTSFSCNSGPQRIWKNIEAANIDQKGELEAFPGFIMEVITNAASDVNTSVLVSVNGTPYSYYGPGPAPLGVLDWGPMAVPPSSQLILEPFLPAGANVTIEVCDARGVAQSFAYTVNDYSTGVVLKSGTATPSTGNCTSMNFILSSPVMTWNIDNNATLITNNNDGSGSFDPSSLSVGAHVINYSWSNGQGCSITASQNITINPLVVPNSTNVSICSGSTATLTATGASVYNWYNAATGGTKVGSSNVYTTPVLSAPTSYWISSGSGLCESARLKVDVTIKPDVAPTFNAILAICQNAVAPLLQNPSNDSKTGTWNPSIINTSTAGTTAYVFTPTAGQCASVKTINITINPKVTPIFNLTSDICINSTGQSLPLISDNSIPGTWVPSAIVSTTAGTSTYQFTPSAGQCAQGTTETINVLANPLANATPSVITGNPILNVDFTNTSTNATSLNWDFGNGVNSTVNGNTTATYTSAGTYTVTLTAINNICPNATWTQVIIVKPIDPLVVVIPNIFTPNNDGVNDEYFIDVKNAETFEAAIFNRWGNELFSLAHSSDKWNGKLSSGDLADEGTYFVKYKIVGIDKTIQEGVTFFHLGL